MGTRVYLTNPDGKRSGFTFAPQAGGSLLGTVFTPHFTPDPGVFDQLEVDAVTISQRQDGTFGLFLIGLPYNPADYRLIRKDGTVYHYGQFSGLQKVTDRNANKLVYTKDGIFHSSGASIQFLRDAQGRITQIIDPAGHPITYRYDAAGNLTAVTDQSGVTTQFTYLDEPAHFLKEVIDPLGRIAQRTEYDEQGRVVAATDALGNRRAQFWDPTHFTGTVTNGRGHVTELIYDARGNILQQTDPRGGVFTWTYDANDNTTSTTDENGNTTLFTYDERGNVLTQTDALGGVTLLTYDALNNVTSITDPLGRAETFGYNATGNRIKRVNANGDATSYTYDGQGRLITATDFNGHLYQFKYGALGLPIEVINPHGTSVQGEYNHFGQLVLRIDETGVRAAFEYDAVGRLITLRDGQGNEIVQTYNGHLLASRTYPLHRTTRLEYDDAGRLIRGFDSLNGKTAFTYDADANRTSVTDAGGNTTTFAYDQLNRNIARVDPFGNISTFSYDPVGKRTEMVDRNGRRRTFAYDALNRQVKERWFDNNNTIIRTIESTYDAVGNRLSISDPDSAYTFSYDKRNQLTHVDNFGTPNRPNVLLSHSYDANGNRITTQDGSGTHIKALYDDRNRLVGKTWVGTEIVPARIDFSYDECGCGRKTGIRRYADLDGLQLIGSSRWNYDVLGRLTTITHIDGANSVLAEYIYSYDAESQITGEVHHKQIFDYVYDQAGQLIDASRSIFGNEHFTYDANGNRTNDGTLVGNNNQILSDKKFDYHYDAEGNLVGKLERVTGNVTEYTYDHHNRLTRVEERDGNTLLVNQVAYTYDALDRRIGKTSKTETQYTMYDGDNAWADFDQDGHVLTQYLFGNRIDEILARFRPVEGTTWYLTDKLGTVRDLVDGDGNVINHIDYDSFGHVLGQANSAAGDRFLFTGREFDAEIGLYYYRARYYDPNLGRFLSQDPLEFDAADTNFYRYVHNDPLNRTDPTGLLTATEKGILVATVLAVGTIGVDAGVAGLAVTLNELCKKRGLLGSLWSGAFGAGEAVFMAGGGALAGASSGSTGAALAGGPLTAFLVAGNKLLALFNCIGELLFPAEKEL